MAAELKTVPRAEWQPPTRERVARIRDRLRELYGVPVQPPHRDPLGELVLTLLSQSTNDRNRDVAYLRLREMVGDWEAVRAPPVPEIEEAIRRSAELVHGRWPRVGALVGLSAALAFAAGLILGVLLIFVLSESSLA
ncbi:MAG TPA: hypothetical protein PKB03_06135, partial [Baekduia sp.]|nr:hypothetical protein [Baekduia sp.]